MCIIIVYRSSLCIAHASVSYHMIIYLPAFQLTVQVIQSVVLGYLAGSITDNSDTSTTNAYLFAMGE